MRVKYTIAKLLLMLPLLFIGMVAEAQSCFNPAQVDSTVACPLVFDPVCGCDGITYGNQCEAVNYGGVTSWTPGACSSSGGCQANFNYLQAIGPSGFSISFQNTSFGNYTSVAWDFGDGHFSSQPNPSHTYFSAGTYTVCLTISDSTRNCHDMICKDITITGNGGCVDSNMIDSTMGCFTLYDPVCGCDGVTYGNACEAQYWGGVTRWTQGSCPNSGICHADFEYSVIVGFAGYTVFFTNTSSGNYDFSFWSFGDGAVSSQHDPSHTYLLTNLPTVIEVCLSINDSSQTCNDTYCEVIQLNPSNTCYDPTVVNQNTTCPLVFAPVCGCDGVTYNNACEAYYWHGITSWTQGQCPTTGGCQANFTFTRNGAGFQFTNTSTGSYDISSWDFGDGSISHQADPQHVFDTSGRYNVCLTILDTSTHCMDTVCKSLFVLTPNTNCVDSTLISNDPCPQVYAPVCGCDGVTYSNQCVAMHHGGVSRWTNGPCGPVNLNSCQAFFDFRVDPTPIGYEVSFADRSTAQHYQTSWDFGDGTTSNQRNPLHTYLVPGNYVVCLTITDTTRNCSDTYCSNIRVGFTSTCIDSSVIDTVACPGVIDPVCGCDGNTYLNSCEAYYYNGVTFWTRGACNSGGCQASFSYSMDSTTNRVTFNNNSLGAYTQVFWDFGNGVTSSQANPSYSFNNLSPQVYNVCLSIYNSTTQCFDTYCQNVAVEASPHGFCSADFIWTADSTGLGVQFSGSTTGNLLNYNWDFGDGTTDSVINPMHEFNHGGAYNVCLTVSGQGCSDTYCDSVMVQEISAIQNIAKHPLNIKVYPNPFSKQTNISFALDRAHDVEVAIYDIVGKKVARFDLGQQQAGRHQLTWDAADKEAGIYFLCIKTGKDFHNYRLNVIR